LASTGQTAHFTYDFVGNLLTQSDTGQSLNLTKSFVLDDLTNIAYESASDGSSYSVLSGRSLDSHMAIIPSSGQLSYGLTDAINSTIATVDQGGAVQAQYFYDAFGQTTTTGTFPFQYTGRVPVSGGLYYYRARFYNSPTGRFISEDPIGLGGGDVNLYRYVSNAPTLLTDPLGLVPSNKIKFGCPEKCGLIVGAACTGGAVAAGVFGSPALGLAFGASCGLHTYVLNQACNSYCGVPVQSPGCSDVVGTVINTGTGVIPIPGNAATQFCAGTAIGGASTVATQMICPAQ
jgi:RHS repeat-associated protein